MDFRNPKTWVVYRTSQALGLSEDKLRLHPIAEQINPVFNLSRR